MFDGRYHGNELIYLSKNIHFCQNKSSATHFTHFQKFLLLRSESYTSLKHMKQHLIEPMADPPGKLNRYNDHRICDQNAAFKRD